MAVIGIDLGTTNSLAGVWQDGKVVLIPNAFGEYLTPSVVSIGKNQEVFVGSVAKEMLATQPYDLKEIWAQIFCTETAEKNTVQKNFRHLY